MNLENLPKTPNIGALPPATIAGSAKKNTVPTSLSASNLNSQFAEARKTRPVFDYEQEDDEQRMWISVYGGKGSGKTVGPFMLEGTMLVFSMDGKAPRVKATVCDKMGRDARSIHIYMPTKYIRPTEELNPVNNMEEYLESALHAYDYMMGAMDYWIAKGGVDWVMFDASEWLKEWMEMLMRLSGGVGSAENFKNLGLWKKRRKFLLALLNRAELCSHRGLIFTTYGAQNEIKDDNGNVIGFTEYQPRKWTDYVEEKSDITIQLRKHTGIDGTTKRHAIIFDSKFDNQWPVGAVYALPTLESWADFWTRKNKALTHEEAVKVLAMHPTQERRLAKGAKDAAREIADAQNRKAGGTTVSGVQAPGGGTVMQQVLNDKT